MDTPWRYHGAVSPPWRLDGVMTFRFHHGDAIVLGVQHGGTMSLWWAKRNIVSPWRPHCDFESTNMATPWRYEPPMTPSRCLHAGVGSSIWWNESSMVSTWRPHGATMVPPWYRHGESKASWCCYDSPMAPPWHHHNASMVELVPPRWRQCSAVPPWRHQSRHGSPIHGDTMGGS